MMDEGKLASEESIEKTIKSLASNGIEVLVVDSKDEAKKKILELIPVGSEVMAMQSVTLLTTGIAEEIDEGAKYISVKNKLKSMKRETQNNEMQKLGAAPTYSV